MKDKKSLLVLVVSWSVYFVLCDSLIKQNGSPLFSGALLRIGSFLLLSVYTIISRQKRLKKLNKKEIIRIIATGIIAFIYDLLINIGLKYSRATAGTALLKTDIVFVYIISIVYEKTRVDKKHIIWSLLMMLGAVFIVFGSPDNISFDIWSLLFVVSALINAACAVMLKKIQVEDGLDGYQIAYINNFISMILYIILYSVFQDVQIKTVEINIVQMLGCVLCQSLLISTYYCALGRWPVWFVKSIVLSIPALTAIIQGVFMGESISLFESVGIALIMLGGVLLLNRK